MYSKLSVVRNCTFFLLITAALFFSACREAEEIVISRTQQPDKSQLKNEIEKASALHDDLIVCVDGSSVDPDDYWVEDILKHSLLVALEDAITIKDKEDASREEIELAIQGLKRALDAIEDAKQKGTRAPSEKSALETAIAAAKDKMSDVKESSDGLDVPDKSKWASVEMFTVLKDVIASAELLNNYVKATQEEIDAMVTVLEAAAAAFIPNIAQVNRVYLMNGITAANILLNNNGLQRSIDGSDVHKSRYWVTHSAVSEFEGAITTASSIYNKTNAAQNEINTAVSNLQNASNKFDNGKQFGTNEIDRYYLSKAIEDAEKKLAGVVISIDGSTVLNSLKWVTQKMFNALNAVREEADELYKDNFAVQEDVDAMIVVLNAAINDFTPQPGLLTAGVISYVFNQPEDENIVLSYTQTLSWFNDDKLQVSVTGSYDSYLWTYIDGGNVIQNITGNSLTVNARDFGPGAYSISLKVIKNGVPYTKTLTFNVE